MSTLTWYLLAALAGILVVVVFAPLIGWWCLIISFVIGFCLGLIKVSIEANPNGRW